MQATELRIGNLVNKSYSETHFVPVNVTLWDINNIRNNDEVYTPIPLTEDWLLKLGFKMEEFAFTQGKPFRRYKLGPLCYGTSNGTWSYYSQVIRGIEYVHQLQNLFFCLTGEELEVKQPV
jgi:hypothetical protein